MKTPIPPSARKPLWTKVVLLLFVAAIAGASYFALFSRQSAPDVTFSSLDGKQISMQSLRGKVVVVNFWATSCTTCVAEMPEMVETYEKYKARGMDFVAVAMQYDPPNYVINFAQTRKLPFTVALDHTGNVAAAFGDVQMTPTTFVVDKNGTVLKRYLGQPDFAAFHQLLEQALAA
ncbi:MAG TPA: TlpA disulfide reductase family protein [Noviherbaspirillum sp.]